MTDKRTNDESKAGDGSKAGDDSKASEGDLREDIASLGYEQARDELAGIVQQLESGAASLEDSMRLWERGEQLAAHCERWLNHAEDRINTMTSGNTDGAGS